MIDTRGGSPMGRVLWAVFYHGVIGLYVFDIDALSPFGFGPFTYGYVSSASIAENVLSKMLVQEYSDANLIADCLAEK
jgi:succinate dehydrogenase/fumarate reductase cytochrome b subunit